MGQFCIDLSIDVTGLLLALLIAVALMLTCGFKSFGVCSSSLYRYFLISNTIAFSYAAAPPLVGINGSPDSQRQEGNRSHHPRHHCSPVTGL
ncbi:hypothetical protein V6N13_128276 [Hibiscus sabdariffa]|uniref:Uncharacterized protein n=1 Tax=Hibiscus sabdariffa TaxID=183260 RepID=A0ABR2P1E7_9ROSI